MKAKVSAFTLVELLVAMSILTMVMGGIAFINITSQRYLKASSAFITVSGNARNSLERIVRPIRQANLVNITSSGDRIDIRYDRNEPPTASTSDDINVAFYFDNNKLYLLDNDPGTQDGVLVNNVAKIGTNNIFSKNGNEVTIMYKVQDDYPNDGYQAQDITTRAIMRN